MFHFFIISYLLLRNNYSHSSSFHLLPHSHYDLCSFSLSCSVSASLSVSSSISTSRYLPIFIYLLPISSTTLTSRVHTGAPTVQHLLYFQCNRTIYLQTSLISVYDSSSSDLKGRSNVTRLKVTFRMEMPAHRAFTTKTLYFTVISWKMNHCHLYTLCHRTKRSFP